MMSERFLDRDQINFHAFVAILLHHLLGRNLSMSARKACVSTEDASDEFFSLLAQRVFAVLRTSAGRSFFHRKHFQFLQSGAMIYSLKLTFSTNCCWS